MYSTEQTPSIWCNMCSSQVCGSLSEARRAARAHQLCGCCAKKVQNTGRQRKLPELLHPALTGSKIQYTNNRAVASHYRLLSFLRPWASYVGGNTSPSSNAKHAERLQRYDVNTQLQPPIATCTPRARVRNLRRYFQYQRETESLSNDCGPDFCWLAAV